MVMQSPSDVETWGPLGIFARNWITDPVGKGDLNVEADRRALGPVIEEMIDERMAAKRAEDTEDGMRWYRFLHAIKARFLVDTGVAVAPIPTLVEWMEKLGFTSAKETDSHGWSPLRYAVYEGRVGAR